MRHEPGLRRLRIAIVAIAAMIVVSSAGAMSSYLWIDNSIAIDDAASWPVTSDYEDCWLCPTDALDPFVSRQFPGDVAEWSSLEYELYAGDPGTVDSADHPDAVAAAEITFPILTVLAVVAMAQRLAESHPDRDESSATRAGDGSNPAASADATLDQRQRSEAKSMPACATGGRLFSLARWSFPR